MTNPRATMRRPQRTRDEHSAGLEWLQNQRYRNIASKRIGEVMHCLDVTENGQYLIRTMRPHGAEITPIPEQRALDIQLREKGAEIEDLLKAKLKLRREGAIDGRSFDTSRDVLIATYSCPIEAAGLYRTDEGDFYIRLVSPRADAFFTFGATDFDFITELLDVWFGPYPMFRAFVDMLSVHARGCLKEEPNWDG